MNKQNSSVYSGRQTGVTLVELLIAMGLSIFLVAAVVQSFLGSKQGSAIVQAQARMQENARFAYMFMNRSVRMAGYPTDLIEPNSQPDVSISDPGWRANKMPANADYADFAEQAVVWGEEGSSGVATDAKSPSDVMHVRFQGMADGSVADCQGRAIDAGEWGQVTFYIDDDNNFRCRADAGAAKVQDEVLVQGIEEMQILYGLHAGSVASPPQEFDASQVVNFVNASEVAADQWAMVSAIKVALLSASDSEPLSAAGLARQYDLLDYSTQDYVDGKARQQFAQTIRIRNQNWSAKQ